MSLENDLGILDKAKTFRDLHLASGTIVMPCAWDAFSAILFGRSGVSCLATTSGGCNWVKGRKDYVYTTPMSEMLGAYGDIAAATDLPVSGDLENGYGESPDAVAETIEQSVAAGLVGGSIEDQGDVPTDQYSATVSCMRRVWR